MPHTHIQHLAAIVALTAAIAVSSCSHSGKKAGPSLPEGALAAADGLTAYPDSIAGASISAPDTVPIDSAAVWMEADGDRLICRYFNSHPKASTPAAYDFLSPYDIVLHDALFSPEQAAKRLAARVNADGNLLTVSAANLDYPVIAADAPWAYGARQILYSDPSDHWRHLCRKALTPLLDGDRTLAFNPDNQLFRGASPLLVTSCRYPDWMNPADLAATSTLEGNAARYVALDLLATISDNDDELRRQRDSLGVAISTWLRAPHEGRYTSMLYGATTPIAAPDADNLAQAMAVIEGVASPAEAAALVSRTPIGTGIIPPYLYDAPSSLSDFQALRLKMLTNAAWGTAASLTGNRQGVARALGAMILLAYQTENAENSGNLQAAQYASVMMRTLVVRGLTGVSLTEAGLKISPCVPKHLSGHFAIHNLPYREAVIDIEIIGAGNLIDEFLVDGTASPTAILSPSLNGHHSVKITLKDSDDRSLINQHIAAAPSHYPQVTIVEGATEGFRFPEMSSQADTIAVYVDGVMHYNTTASSITIPADSTRSINTWAFAASTKGNPRGFTCRPFIHIPDNDHFVVDIDTIANPGSRVMSTERHRPSPLYVESRRYKNASISFDYKAHADGSYLLQVAYLNGLGIVNPEMVVAYRTLTVNDHTAGLIIFPQLTPDDWDVDHEWNTRRGITLPLTVHLHQGVNHLSLNYFAPTTDANFNHDANLLIPLQLILSRL